MPETKEVRSETFDASSTSQKAATEGAQSVAEAVRKVADAAVAEVQKASARTAPAGDFIVRGSAGGRFQIDGPPRSFGASGTVILNGQQLETLEWGANRIVGRLPAEAKSGTVTVFAGSDVRKTGHLQL